LDSSLTVRQADVKLLVAGLVTTAVAHRLPSGIFRRFATLNDRYVDSLNQQPVLGIEQVCGIVARKRQLECADLVLRFFTSERPTSPNYRRSRRVEYCRS
jgi:hypothetical protein